MPCSKRLWVALNAAGCWLRKNVRDVRGLPPLSFMSSRSRMHAVGRAARTTLRNVVDSSISSSKFREFASDVSPEMTLVEATAADGEDVIIFLLSATVLYSIFLRDTIVL
jgi:hypothetical protein